MLRYLICSFLLCGSIFVFNSCKKTERGCTDARATNFSLSADEDDGSCIIPGDPLPGSYIYNGNRSGNGDFTTIVDSFSIVSLGDKKYKLTNLTGCAEIVVLSQGASMVLQSSDCQINSWTCFFSSQPGNSTLNFMKTVGSNNYNYTGKFTKL